MLDIKNCVIMDLSEYDDMTGYIHKLNEELKEQKSLVKKISDYVRDEARTSGMALGRIPYYVTLDFVKISEMVCYDYENDTVLQSLIAGETDPLPETEVKDDGYQE